MISASDILAQISGSGRGPGTIPTLYPISSYGRLSFSSGSGYAQGEHWFGYEETCDSSYTIVDTTTSDIDLTDMTDPIAGGSLSLLFIKAILVINQESYATDPAKAILFGNHGGGTNGFVGPFSASTVTCRIEPSSFLLLPTPLGWACGTGYHLLRLRAASGTCAYRMVILGNVTAP